MPLKKPLSPELKRQQDYYIARLKRRLRNGLIIAAGILVIGAIAEFLECRGIIQTELGCAAHQEPQD